MLYEFGDTSYHLDNHLENHWKNTSLEYLKKTNQDRVYVVDGRERIGKSTWAIQQFGYLEPSAFEDTKTFVSRIVFTPDDFFNAVRKLKNSVIIFDEAFRGLSSRSALSKINRKLLQALMEMGQNNNIVFIVLPSIFRLDSYPAVERSHGLFNIYLDKKHNLRTWRGWNTRDKNKIYNMGIRKGHDYPVNTGFKGRFYDKFPGGDKFLKAYLKKKADSLSSMDFNEGKAKQGQITTPLELQLLNAKYKELKSLRKLAEWSKEAGLDYNKDTLRTKLILLDENQGISMENELKKSE